MGLEDLPTARADRIVTTSVMDYMHFYDLKREDFDLVGIIEVYFDCSREVKSKLVVYMAENGLSAITELRISSSKSDHTSEVFAYGTGLRKREKKKDDGVVKIGPEK
jgi:hypothetical protein